MLLVNGDMITAAVGSPGSRPGVIASAGSGLPGSVLSVGLGGKAYEIPAAALPYQGRGLDLSLFDVALLAKREAGGRLPVQVGYRGHRPRLPGVTITRAGGGVAEGYLTAASARAFGAALVHLFLCRPRQRQLRAGWPAYWAVGDSSTCLRRGRLLRNA